MPTIRRLPAVLFLAALLLSACARGQATDPAATPAPAIAPPTTPQASGEPKVPPSTAGPPVDVDRPGIGRCAASALRGSNQGSDGAAGTIWFTIQLRNISARTCTVKGSPGVRLLSVQGQPLIASTPVRLDGGSLVTLRPGRAARLVFSSPHACDSFVMASRIRVTLSHGQGSLVVQLGEDLDACRHLYVQHLEPATA
jgi:hypothetical protein